MPDVYPSDDLFHETVSKLDPYTQITILDYLRGEVGAAQSNKIYYLIAGILFGWILGKM